MADGLLVVSQALAMGEALLVDGAYDRLKLIDKAAYLDFVLEIIHHRDGAKGFELLPSQMGCGTNIRLDDEMATSHARLRASH